VDSHHQPVLRKMFPFFHVPRDPQSPSIYTPHLVIYFVISLTSQHTYIYDLTSSLLVHGQTTPENTRKFRLGREGKTSRFMLGYLARRTAWSIVAVR
jgi:hypothetical protein